jgi:hypothetical protein
MADRSNRKLISGSPGFFQDIALKAKLILRLMGDRRVNPLLKILPIASLVYMVVPDLAFGPLDDAAVIYLGSYLFVELCPPEVVREHQNALNPTPPAGSDAEPPIVIDGEYRDATGDKTSIPE